MTSHGPKHGQVGTAAEALKEALVAKLQPGVKDSPLNDGIYQAIKLVEAFLNSCKESQAELDALKAQIKRIMMSQIAARASPPHQRFGDVALLRGSRSAGSSDQPLLPHPHHRHQQPGASTSPQNDAEVAASSAAKAAAAAGGQARVQLYSRTSARSAGSASLDWTLPQKSLNRKAYVRNGDFGRMTLVQDELARKAEALRQQEEALRKKATLAVVNEQMDIVQKRRAAEREARRLAQLEMDEEVRQYQAWEEERQRNHRELQESLRNFYAGQVDERMARKRMEDEERQRDNEADRQQLKEEERREKARQEQLAREHAVNRDLMKRALMTAMDEKAAAKAAAVEEEARYNKEYMAKMDADEAARRRAVAMRQEKMRKAFERAGGVALQNKLQEQIRAEAERAARLAAEVEAAITERERRDAERRKKAAEDALRELNGQKEALEAARREAAVEYDRSVEERLRKEEQARKERQEAKAARRRAQEEALKLQKQELIDQHRRRFNEYREPFEDRYRFLHAGPLAGTQRAFNNLAVPDGKAALVASITLP